MNEIRTIKMERLETGTHAVFFTREYEEDWGYMGMRDYKTYEPTDKYGIDVVPYSNGCACNVDAGCIPSSFEARGFDKDMANRIWWNIKHGIDYATLKNAMKGQGFIKRER